MSSLMLNCVKAVLFLTCLVICLPASSQTRSSKALAGSVSGHVTIGGKSAVGIIMGLRTRFGPQSTPIYKATTDQDGNYRISGIPAGDYRLSPMTPAYVSNTKGIIVAEGEVVENIDFALVRGGVVTGRVTDADEHPLIEEQVYLILADADGPDAGFRPSGPSAQTDDRGIYRIFGISAGRYKVAVGRNDHSFFDSFISGRQIYKQSFHPNVSDPAKANIVEVGEGTESTNIDITVGRTEQTFTASGRITDDSGQPIANVRFGLRTVVDERRPSIGSFVGSTSASNSKGDFRLENLMPGKYAVFIASLPDSEVWADAVPFEIVDHDVTGLVVKTQKGATIAGIVVLEGSEDKSLLARLSQLRVQVNVRSEGISATVLRTSVINSDLSFRVAGLQRGKANFTLGSSEVARLKGFTILRVERDGVIQPPGIEVNAGEQIGGIKVVVGYGSAAVHGAVRVENGDLRSLAGMSVQINRPGENSFAIRPMQTDSRGHFLFEGLPAGTYEITVTAYVSGARKPPVAKQQINVADGVASDVTIVLDLRPQEPTPRP